MLRGRDGAAGGTLRGRGGLLGPGPAAEASEAAGGAAAPGSPGGTERRGGGGGIERGAGRGGPDGFFGELGSLAMAPRPSLPQNPKSR
jgi:hypothetical protein